MTNQERLEKVEKILETTEKTYNLIIQNEDDFKSFLDSSAYTTKFDFEDQVMIYSQNKDISALATFEMWRDNFGKFVKKGTKGIPLIQKDENGNDKIKYVFDVKDTVDSNKKEDLEKQKRYFLWEYNPDENKDILINISKTLGNEINSNLESDLINNITKSLIKKNENDIRNRFEKLDDKDISINNMLYLIDNTTKYVISKRINDNTNISDFTGITSLKNSSNIKFLGDISNKLSRVVLNEIQKNIQKTLAKNIDSSYTLSKEKNALKNDNNELESNNIIGGNVDERKSGTIRRRILSTRRNLHRSQRTTWNIYTKIWNTSPNLGKRGRIRRNGTRDRTEYREEFGKRPAESGERFLPGQILTNEIELSQESQERTIQRDGIDRGISRGLDTNRTRSRENDERTDRNSTKEMEYNSRDEKRKSDGMGKTDEQYKGYNRGNNTKRDNIQVENELSTFFMQRDITQKVEHSLKDENNIFRITEDIVPENLKPAQRLNNNMHAIATLKRLEKENRPASEYEKEILANYVGWGGLAEVFDENKNTEGQWYETRKFLKENLTEEEYKNARASTLTSFYTPKVVIDSIYKVLNNLGFESGEVLEPSCGVGKFLGLMPNDMQQNSKISAVEIDTLSGNITKTIYDNKNIDIQVKGFEKANFPDNKFDLVMGNVPFGEFKIADSNYNQNLLIHDYFFAKSIDKVRPGGIIAFITSDGTLDKKDDSIRRYIGERTDFLGAIRLPNDTFKNVVVKRETSDIIFLQKREKQRQVHSGLHNFLNLKADKNGLLYNQYFIDNPDMVLGEMKEILGRFGGTITCVKDESIPLKNLLDKAISNIKGSYIKKEIEIKEEVSFDNLNIDDYRNFSYHLINDEILYRQNFELSHIKLKNKEKEQFKSLIQIRDLTRNILDSQLNDISDSELKQKQNLLNTLYDEHLEKYGYIRDNANIFTKDSSYPLLLSLEKWEDDKYISKSDIFSKRTIRKSKVKEQVDTSIEALVLSVAEKGNVDIEYMCNLTQKNKENLIQELKGEIFLDIQTYLLSEKEKYLTKDEYLSGNVRRKAKFLEEYIKNNDIEDEKINEIIKYNIDSLNKVIPKDIDAADISVQIGATWIPNKYYDDFMYETFHTPSYAKEYIKVNYSKYTSTYNISDKRMNSSNETANLKYATKRTNVYDLVEDLLNSRDTNVYDRVVDEKGNKVSVLNHEETTLARQKQEYINDVFKDWIFQDKQRRDDLVRIYNDKFNSIKLREYDGSNMIFPGMSIEKTLKKHQKDAVAHSIFGGNTLFAHCVGAGKTYEMITSAMESKRLGLCTKSLFVVPNHITQQTAGEFLDLYPNANILVATEKDFEKKNRKLFTSKMATGNYDAIIIGQTQFERIPMSDDYQKDYIFSQIEEITKAIVELKEQKGEKFTVKQLEKTKKTLEATLEKLNNKDIKDDVVTFEQLGVDKLFVDEAHDYKNLHFITKMKNVAGVAPQQTKKCYDMFMKCRYMDKITNSKGIVFATGTPISNSMTELYTMQRYLQYEDLKENNHHFFDAWASNYGQKVTQLELAPEGKGFRQKTRFAKYVNLPELMTLFKKIADIKTPDMLNLPVPNAIYENIVVKANDYQKEILESFVQRAINVRNKLVAPTEDNMLKITTDGRKLALDQRLINPLLPKSSDSKTSICVNKIYEIYKETQDKKSTQVVFCDTSTPSSKKFNVYDDMKQDLIEKGIKENEIAFIHDAKTKAEKDKLFKKVKKGEVRVIFGSTAMMGTGTNIQDKLIALHDLDCPYRPSDLEQRSGRIIRQGNENKDVYIYRYITENSFDAYLYQLVESKQRIISQVMTSKTIERTIEEDDDIALSYAEIKALATGNPLIKEKMELDTEVNKLKLLKAEYNRSIYDLQDKIEKTYPEKISDLEYKISNIEKDLSIFKENSDKNNKQEFSGMTIQGQFYQDKKEAGEKLLETIKKLNTFDYNKVIGNYKGFDFLVNYDTFDNKFIFKLQKNHSYSINLSTDYYGNFTRIDNKLNSIEELLNNFKNKLQETKNQLIQAKQDVNRPFYKEDLLKEKTERLKFVESKINAEEKNIKSLNKDKEKLELAV